MEKYKNKYFAKWASNESITDASLNKDNLTQKEEEQLRIVAKEFLKLSAQAWAKLKKDGKIIKIED